MSIAEIVLLALAFAGFYIAVSRYWDRILIFVLMIAFQFEYWQLSRKIRKAAKTAEFTVYAEPDHVKFKRERFVERRDRTAQLSNAIKREHDEARAQNNRVSP